MKTPTKIKCHICVQHKPPIESYLDKEPWGKNRSQHYMLTCNKCGWSAEINEGFLKILEEGK